MVVVIGVCVGGRGLSDVGSSCSNVCSIMYRCGKRVVGITSGYVTVLCNVGWM